MTTAKTRVPQVSTVDAETNQIILIAPPHTQAVVALLRLNAAQFLSDVWRDHDDANLFPFRVREGMTALDLD